MRNTKINHFLWHFLVIVTWVFIALNLISVWNFSYAFTSTWSDYKDSRVLVSEDDVYSDEVEFNSAPEYSEKIMKMKVSYEKKLIKIIWNKLMNVSDEKLEKVILKIDTILDTIEKKKNISKTKKDQIIAQLLALKDIIYETINDKYYSIDIDLDNILGV